ncbi:MAG: pimeloyl-[acyl-carrier protein] methyl ester esterase [Gammaproteobacteria bacterium]|jgi:pimeloyl-[acyl-carrier protein] methyl ester esterase
MRIVLLPGLDGTGLLFEPLLACLAPGVDATVVSYPGDEPFGYEELLPRIISVLPTGDPFVLLGESFAGPLALQVAGTRPPGLVGVVLCATFVSCPYHFVPAWAASLVLSFPFHLAPFFSALKSAFGGYVTPELRSLSERAIASVDADVLAKRIREVIAVDATSALIECPVPVAYLQATRDRVVPASNLRRILAQRPDVRVTQVHSPHMLLQTSPQEAADVIDAFVQFTLEKTP